MEHITNILREKKIKVTPQRIAIYSVLLNTTSHPTAELIYKSVSQTHPCISLATVYKTLALFKSAGLVQEINADNQTSHYDAQVNFHPHTICLKCGKVGDFFCNKFLDKLKEELYKSQGFSSKKEQLYFYGICKECQ